MKSRVAALALVIAGVIAYSSSFSGVFVFDDDLAIVENPNIRQVWPLSRAITAPKEATTSGRPVPSLTFAVNYALAPPDARESFRPVRDNAPPDEADRVARNAWGYHFVNLIIHLLAGLTLFGIVRRTLRSETMQDLAAGAADLVAFAIALLWIVHPLNTSAVTYLVQRVESLMGLFLLLTLYCAIRAWGVSGGPACPGRFDRGERSALRTEGPQIPLRRPGLSGPALWWTLAAIVACALGMASKEVMVVAPLVVPLWDWTFGPRARALARRWPLYAGLAATWLILVALVLRESRAHSVGFGFAEWPWPTYLATQAGVVSHYLRLSFWPSPLVFDYAWPPAHGLMAVLPQVVLIGALGTLTVIALARRRAVGFAGAWFFLILAPTSSVLPITTEIAAEHRMYLPLAAVVAVIVTGTCLYGRRLAPARPVAAASITALLAAALALIGLTTSRNHAYASDAALWLDTIQKQPANARAHHNYALDLLDGGMTKEAEVHLRIAVGLKPDEADAQKTLGAVLCSEQQFDEGIPHLERAVQLDPEDADAFQNLGEAYGARGQRGLALGVFTKALALRPADVFLLSRASWLLSTSPEDALRDGARAVTLAERAVAGSARRNAMALDTLAAAYAETNRFEDAVTTARAAIDEAHAEGREDLAAGIAERLASYQAHQKIRAR